MEKKVEPSGIHGIITAPSSKSFAQRALAASLLTKGTTTLTNLEFCNDTSAALGVIKALGARVDKSGPSEFRITGGGQPLTNSIDIGESGLSARMFSPIAALYNSPLTINGHGSILSRPLDTLAAPLRQLGVSIRTNNGLLPIEVTGPIRGGHALVDGSVSSQFITGLLMACPLAEEDTTLTVESPKSRPYIKMTLDLLEQFGIDVKNNEYREFFIPGGQHYQPQTYNIEGDWSGASCLLVAGAIAGEVTIRNLNPLSSQADGVIIDALARAGAEIVSEDNTITVRSRGALKPFEFDATDCPDLFPALAVLAANCHGTSHITGIERLTHKESNRAETIAEEFAKAGILVVNSDNRMIITGAKKIKNAVFDSHNDHRIAMAAAVLALKADDVSIITGAEAVNKSYPAFWEDLDNLNN